MKKKFITKEEIDEVKNKMIKQMEEIVINKILIGENMMGIDWNEDAIRQHLFKKKVKFVPFYL